MPTSELELFYQSMNDEDRSIFSEIADFAVGLGYKPKQAKTKALNIVFTGTKTKKHLLKMSLEDGKPVLKMKFSASKSYSELFQEGIRAVIEEFNFKYVGCYGCGKCAGEPEGYQYRHPNGQEYFRCGSELIPLPPISRDNIPEILRLLTTQHDYYLSKSPAV